jgi:hypothetical protein
MYVTILSFKNLVDKTFFFQTEVDKKKKRIIRIFFMEVV